MLMLGIDHHPAPHIFRFSLGYYGVDDYTIIL